MLSRIACTIPVCLLTTVPVFAQDPVDLAASLIGRPYVWGAEGPNSFDCSGLTQYVFGRHGIELPRRAISQSQVGDIIRGQLRRGDLVFFSSGARQSVVTHVGIYEGGGVMIDASQRHGRVRRDSLREPFWEERFLFARRILSSRWATGPDPGDPRGPGSTRGPDPGSSRRPGSGPLDRRTALRILGRCRAATSEPSTIVFGPSSPPMASIAMRKISYRLPAASFQKVSASGLFHRLDLTSFVVAAVRAHLVRNLGFLTLRAGADRHGAERIMGAAFGGAALGMPPFWIRHDRLSFFSRSSCSADS
jgi:hypothetical protein